eukprot:jgi/Botrbrau1/20287/Bobra.31_1s0069.2
MRSVYLAGPGTDYICVHPNGTAIGVASIWWAFDTVAGAWACNRWFEACLKTPCRAIDAWGNQARAGRDWACLSPAATIDKQVTLTYGSSKQDAYAACDRFGTTMSIPVDITGPKMDYACIFPNNTFAGQISVGQDLSINAGTRLCNLELNVCNTPGNGVCSAIDIWGPVSTLRKTWTCVLPTGTVFPTTFSSSSVNFSEFRCDTRISKCATQGPCFILDMSPKGPQEQYFCMVTNGTLAGLVSLQSAGDVFAGARACSQEFAACQISGACRVIDPWGPRTGRRGFQWACVTKTGILLQVIRTYYSAPYLTAVSQCNADLVNCARKCDAVDVTGTGTDYACILGNGKVCALTSISSGFTAGHAAIKCKQEYPQCAAAINESCQAVDLYDTSPRPGLNWACISANSSMIGQVLFTKATNSSTAASTCRTRFNSTCSVHGACSAMDVTALGVLWLCTGRGPVKAVNGNVRLQSNFTKIYAIEQCRNNYKKKCDNCVFDAVDIFGKQAFGNLKWQCVTSEGLPKDSFEAKTPLSVSEAGKRCMSNCKDPVCFPVDITGIKMPLQNKNPFKQQVSGSHQTFGDPHYPSASLSSIDVFPHPVFSYLTSNALSEQVPFPSHGPNIPSVDVKYASSSSATAPSLVTGVLPDGRRAKASVPLFIQGQNPVILNRFPPVAPRIALPNGLAPAVRLSESSLQLTSISATNPKDFVLPTAPLALSVADVHSLLVVPPLVGSLPAVPNEEACLLEGKDFFGHDFLEPFVTENYQDCCNSCRAIPECAGWTWNSAISICFVKDLAFEGMLLDNPDNICGYVRRTEIPPAATCKMNVGQAYPVDSAIVSNGGDAIKLKTAQECCNVCSSRPGNICKAWTFILGNEVPENKGSCYLLHTAITGTAVINPHATSGGQSVSQSTLRNMTCPFDLYPGMELNGADTGFVRDVQTAEACCAICSLHPICHGWTWSEETCYAKTVVYPSMLLPNKVDPRGASGVKIWTRYPQVECPNFFVGQTFFGGSPWSTAWVQPFSPNFTDCCSRCMADSLCKNWEWQVASAETIDQCISTDASNGTPGVCRLKRIVTYSSLVDSNQNIISGFRPGYSPFPDRMGI